MLETAAVYTSEKCSAGAGRDLGRQIADALGGQAPDAAIVFASSQFDYQELLEALDGTCGPKAIVGASSAGEFTSQHRGEGTACALAFTSPEIRATAGLGRGVSMDRVAAARDVVASFNGVQSRQYPYRAALVLTDALAGHADDLVEQLTIATAGAYQFAGGGAGDDARFERTDVFCGTKAYSDAVVALELLSPKPFGIGVGHGWIPAGPPLRVTESEGARIISLNGLPAVEAFDQHAAATQQTFDHENPMPFFLHNIVGIDTGNGYRLRVPLAIGRDGSISCAADIPRGARVHLMQTTGDSAVKAAQQASEAAVQRLHGRTPAAALFFDCVATRLRMGDAFGFELESVVHSLGGAKLVGCNTYGQIARAEGQFSGFHNCTAVVLALPD